MYHISMLVHVERYYHIFDTIKSRNMSDVCQYGNTSILCLLTIKPELCRDVTGVMKIKLNVVAGNVGWKCARNVKN